MARRPITNPIEYLQAARRRCVWILAPTVVISALTVVVARKLPKLFESSALIVVEQQRVPKNFVQSTVSSNVAQRLEYIEEQILSRTELSQIIQRYGLYQHQGLTTDAQVTQMLTDITITPIIDPNQHDADVSAFRIAYQGPDPVLAQEVTRDLSNLFITENLKSRAAQALGTESFIDGQVQQASLTLQTLQTQLRDLKSQYMGSLPEQQGANLQVLGQLQTVLQADADDLARAQQQKTYLTSLAEAVSNAGPAAALAANGQPTPAEQQLTKAKSDLAIAQQMYTPEHPAVIRLQAQVAALQKQVDAEKAAASASPKPASTKSAKSADTPKLSPQVQSQITVLDQEIKQRLQDQKDAKAKIAAIQSRIERLPEVEEKLSNLQNAYTVAKANYTTLLEKKSAAATGAAMEQQAEGEEFRLVDPANLPQKPVSPNIPRIELMGVLGALLVGVGLAFLMEMRDAVVRNEADVTYYTESPMLAALPRLRQLASPVLARAKRG